MSDLRVGRLTATVDGAMAGQAKRMDRLLAGVAERRLAAACLSVGVPDGLWCVRRLDVRLEVDLGRPDGELESRWAAALTSTLREALGSGSPDVIHYRNRYDALDELVWSVAAGRTQRVWAWRQLGLVEERDPSPEAAPRALMLAALDRAPERALPGILAAMRAVGLTRLHRALGAQGWQGIARLACRVEAADQGMAEPSPAKATAEPDPTALVEASGASAAEVRTVLADSTLALAITSEELTADEPTLRAWAVLAVTQSSPGRLRQAGSRVLVDAVESALAGGRGSVRRPGLGTGRPIPRDDQRGLAAAQRPDPTTPGRTPPPSAAKATTWTQADQPTPSHTGGDGVPGSSVERSAPDPGPGTAVEPGTEPGTEPGKGLDAGSDPGPEAETEPGELSSGVPTVWGGLLFLFATAREAGVPDEIVAAPALAGRSTRWVVHQVAQRLVPAAPDDPALLAICGLTPDRRAPFGRPPTRRERRVLDRCARRWCAATARRLRRDQLEPADAVDPSDVMLRLASRRAEILAEPGWIEVHLRLDDVDVDARRAGLDLDPGWVSWLGVVVRFVYA